MKLLPLALLAALACPVLACPATASPVHVALQPLCAVSPDADGFFTLGSVAALSGGDPARRTRLAAVVVGRAPLPGETRRLTRGDLSLKLRQAGCDPEKAAVLEGAAAADVTTAPQSVGALLAAPSFSAVPSSQRSTAAEEGAASSAPTTSAIMQSPIIRRGDPVTIVIQSGPLTITAPGIAREGGAAGQAIRVHRDGVMTDLSVHVVDAQTVQMEI